MSKASRPSNDRQIESGDKTTSDALFPEVDANAVPSKPTDDKLTPAEQMALYEKELRENDWGHQPC
ncbi:MAG: hypothetical protein ABIR24_03345 [Verrucomicrobiota bacterium]